ncbi:MULTISPECIES: M23 family metallopeptidase [Flavobacterium]|uniref:M23 family metallopeptidase n=1 Tax=Flavobacterium jumunjinense TaxID=998845 RepID=A0ABV5GSN6_9FLAO|nr:MULTISPECIES: M23 family metallopeptidase [Flavobacterium]
MKKSTWYIIGTTTLLFLIMGTKKAFAKITANQNLRTCDLHGCGSFGASRGNRKHNGIDIITVPGEKIMSPISGTVTRYPYPYGNDLSYTGIEIVNSEYKIKMFYLKPIAPIGSTVFAGKIIGVSQNIAAKYSTAMTNHVHLEVYKKQGTNWILIDPTNLF